jgi:hypothetical protein
LRGCCEVDPPDLQVFKSSIESSLHESERSRCIDEILQSILERSNLVIAAHRRPGDLVIEGDLLIDDRAPAFESANSEWNIKYSPALYSALEGVASQAWDALQITGFDRFWDGRVKSIGEMIMKIGDGDLKRELVADLNRALAQPFTASAATEFNYSITFVTLTEMVEQLVPLFSEEASLQGKELAPFEAPKQPDANEDEELLEAANKKLKGKQTAKKPPPKKAPPKKGGKGDEDTKAAMLGNAMSMVMAAEMSAELKDSLKAIVKRELRSRLETFEKLAAENSGVTRQLTRVNEMERLDTDLAPEINEET